MKTSLTRKAATAFASLVLVVVGVVPMASADDLPGGDQGLAVTVVEAIDGVQPDLVDSAANVATDEEGDTAIAAAIGDVEITVPTDPANPLTIQSDGGDIDIELPISEKTSDAVAAENGIVVFDNNDDSATAPIVREDGSLQINTVISSPDAPTAYPYRIDLPPGTTIEHVGESLLFVNGDKLVGGLAPAWARDADDRNVPTRYVVDGATITQIVEHDATFTYPIVADPWFGFNLFSYVRNDVRPAYNGKPVYTMELSAWGQLVYRGSAALGLATVPMGVGLSIASAGYEIMTNEGWAEVIQRQPKAATTSVKQQYYCHVRYGYPVLGSGWRWDLEAGRPTKSNWTTTVLSHKCNWT